MEYVEQISSGFTSRHHHLSHKTNLLSFKIMSHRKTITYMIFPSFISLMNDYYMVFREEPDELDSRCVMESGKQFVIEFNVNCVLLKLQK